MITNKSSNLLTLTAFLGFIRLPFLALTPVCVAVGVGSAYARTGVLDGVLVFWLLLGALSAHISINAFNEFFDFKSGLDFKTTRTPFSGGSGTLPHNPVLANWAFITATLMLSIAITVGWYVIGLRGWGILPLGLLGLLLVVTYTTWWTYYPLMCLLAPGLGFGIVMVMGIDFALTGHYSIHALFAALPATALSSGILLLNQFPDVAADRSIGRRHYPMTIGYAASAQVYGGLLCVAYGSVILGILCVQLPWSCALTLLSAPLAGYIYRQLRRNTNHLTSLIPLLGMNVALTLITLFLLAVGLFVS
ncbi:prenyltransferase [Hydromonas duriensis]|uniref:1,4-dihydroxy-2-naphthoate octaprenyltransferase n=1 Tax=Hydromonas duriensis TaxID=1527608 RepID=A0A4V3DK17_9BURK|nr:prenyltransferase [Hydromonas duriensis]TDR32376.1 1,4-dihydroxy-2-naphthoate octaprenyltransferase [Hydromonas duriensis]